MIFTYASNEREGMIALEYVISIERVGGKLRIVTLAPEAVEIETTPAHAKALYAEIHAAFRTIGEAEEAERTAGPAVPTNDEATA